MLACAENMQTVWRLRFSHHDHCNLFISFAGRKAVEYDDVLEIEHEKLNIKRERLEVEKRKLVVQ